MRRQRVALFLMLLVIAFAFVIQEVDSAKAKTTKKSGKSDSKKSAESDGKKTKKNRKSKAKKDDSDKDSSDDDDDDTEKSEDDKNKTDKGPKKKWNQFTKADWERMEREAEGPGEPFKPPEPPKMDFDPKNPMKYMQASKKGKPAMMFATVDKIKDEKTGALRERTKEETEEVSFRLKSLMQSGHLDATPYVIDPGRILWTVQDGSKGYEVKKFLLSQPEVVEFEWDQQKANKATYDPRMEAEL